MKATVTLGGEPLAGLGTIAWKFVTGVQPYTTVFSVHTSAWEKDLKNKMGKPLTLSVTDSRGVTTKVQDLFILHIVPSGRPKITSFLVADRRWKWAYKLVARDYNVPKKTGDRTARNKVPVEATITVDEYDYKPYSLDIDVKWTPETALEDLLLILENPGESGKHRIESLPIETTSEDGQFTLQNISLRDQGDAAMARLLSYIPGAQVYVTAEGVATVFDGADTTATQDYFKTLPPNTWDGDKAEVIDRQKIRPNRVRVHYQREVELVLEYEDDYSGQTSAAPVKGSPYIDNVIPTVDPETVITAEYDSELGPVDKTVPPGTYVRVDRWLAAMDLIKPEGSDPWTFATIQQHWLKGDLDGILGGRGLDLDENGNVSMRIQALKQHFRQTFRVNRTYTERLRDVQAIRVAMLDPVTGARAPAAVWGQACVVPTTKGKLMAGRKDPENAKCFRNVDYLAPHLAGEDLIKTSPGPTRVTFVDRDQGIFRLEWMTSPYGTVDSFIPCHLVGELASNTPKVIMRDLSRQEDEPVGAGTRIEGGSNGIYLRDSLQYKIMVTIVPAAPNNKRQFHIESLTADDISDVFRTEFGITDGIGPPLEVFIPPGENTARFSWRDDATAPGTIANLLGLNSDDPNESGIPEGEELEGFGLINQDRELTGHAKAVAAEMLAPFADNLMGRVATTVPKDGLKLVGNMSGATLQVGAAPSAKVNAVHEFPGQQKPISRLALMPESVRKVVLGIVPFGKGDS